MSKEYECVLFEKGCPKGNLSCTNSRFIYCEERKIVQIGYGTPNAKFEVSLLPSPVSL